MLDYQASSFAYGGTHGRVSSGFLSTRSWGAHADRLLGSCSEEGAKRASTRVLPGLPVDGEQSIRSALEKGTPPSPDPANWITSAARHSVKPRLTHSMTPGRKAGDRPPARSLPRA